VTAVTTRNAGVSPHPQASQRIALLQQVHAAEEGLEAGVGAAKATLPWKCHFLQSGCIAPSSFSLS
jgi:hypothetical protein